MIPSEQKLLKLLSNNDVTFFIPPYQRNYEWTFDQCNVFLEDIKKTYVANIKVTKLNIFSVLSRIFRMKHHLGSQISLY